MSLCVSVGGTGGWSSKGCDLISRNNTHISCQCNHMTSFAVLMDISKREVLWLKGCHLAPITKKYSSTKNENTVIIYSSSVVKNTNLQRYTQKRLKARVYQRITNISKLYCQFLLIRHFATIQPLFLPRLSACFLYQRLTFTWA